MPNSEASTEFEKFAEVQIAVVRSGKHWIRNFFPNLRDAGIRWSEDDASSLAASVAYYLALSLFPMMLLLTSGFGIFLQFSKSGKRAEEQILGMVETHASPSTTAISSSLKISFINFANTLLVAGANSEGFKTQQFPAAMAETSGDINN